MKQKIIDLLLESRFFQTRHKWAIVRWIKITEIPEKKLQKMLKLFEMENDFFSGFETWSLDQKLQKVQAFVAKLDADMHHEVFEKIHEAEEKERASENSDKILTELQDV